MSYYLFDRADDQEPAAEDVNPVADRFLRENPNLTLKKDLSFESFQQIVVDRKIGNSRTTVIATNSDRYEELHSKTNLFRIYPVHGAFFQLYESRDEAMGDKEIFVGLGSEKNDNGVRLIMKSHILRRKDYHMSIDWPGGQFEKDKSFSPIELEDFRKYQKSLQEAGNNIGNRNEFVFKHPISLNEVEIILVRPSRLLEMRRLLSENEFGHIQVLSLSKEGRISETSHEEPASQCHRGTEPTVNHLFYRTMLEVLEKEAEFKVDPSNEGNTPTAEKFLPLFYSQSRGNK